MGFKKITIFGSTGLIGSLLLKKLVIDKDFDSINVISRKEINLNSKKINQIISKNFNKKNIDKIINGSDIVFSTIGTTQSRVNFDKAEYLRRY